MNRPAAVEISYDCMRFLITHNPTNSTLNKFTEVRDLSRSTFCEWACHERGNPNMLTHTFHSPSLLRSWRSLRWTHWWEYVKPPMTRHQWRRRASRSWWVNLIEDLKNSVWGRKERKGTYFATHLFCNTEWHSAFLQDQLSLLDKKAHVSLGYTLGNSQW